jgi:hypothetical protein
MTTFETRDPNAIAVVERRRAALAASARTRAFQARFPRLHPTTMVRARRTVRELWRSRSVAWGAEDPHAREVA